MKKKLTIALVTFFGMFFLNIYTSPVKVFAESCGITAKVGSDPNGGNNFYVNTLINMNGLKAGSTYSIQAEVAGKLINSGATFTASQGTIQLAFNLPAIGPAAVHFAVGSDICSTGDFQLPADPHSLPVITNDNLPPAPGVGGVSGNCQNTNYIDTAIGCVPIDNQNDLVGFFIKWGIGIGGGIAFLLIVFAGFQIITSRGDPKRLQGGQELMTSAIAGLLLLIFSVVILKIIGVDILQIPGFAKP